VARKKERATRHRERRDRRSEEFRLREQQGLSSPGTEEYLSSDEEEEEEERLWGRPSLIGGSLPPITGAGSGGKSGIAWGGRGGARR
jgi:hypothetical protein